MRIAYVSGQFIHTIDSLTPSTSVKTIKTKPATPDASQKPLASAATWNGELQLSGQRFKGRCRRQPLMRG